MYGWKYEHFFIGSFQIINLYYAQTHASKDTEY